MSDFFVGSLDTHESSQPFSPDQVKALQHLLKTSFELFGKEVGNIVGGKLAELKHQIDNRHFSTTNDRTDCFTDICEATTALVQEDAAKSNVKTRKRRLRRQMAKSKYQYSKSQLLRCGAPGINELLRATSVPKTTAKDLNARVDHIECMLSSWHALPEHHAGNNMWWDDWRHCNSGLAAPLLAAQVNAAKCIQNTWRRKKLCQQVAEPNINMVDHFDNLVDDISNARAVASEIVPTSVAPKRLADAPLVGMPLISVRDGIALTTVSTWHLGLFSTLLTATFETGNDDDEIASVSSED